MRTLREGRWVVKRRTLQILRRSVERALFAAFLAATVLNKVSDEAAAEELAREASERMSCAGLRCVSLAYNVDLGSCFYGTDLGKGLG